MSDLFGNHIVGFPTRRLIWLGNNHYNHSWASADTSRLFVTSLQKETVKCFRDTQLETGFIQTLSSKIQQLLKDKPLKFQRLVLSMNNNN